MKDKQTEAWADTEILVTGGSGFLGINLIRYLLDRGFRRVRTLDIAEFDYPERDRVTALVGDIRDRSAVESATKGVRWIVHAAAALPLYSDHDIFSTEVLGTRTLLETAAEAGVERFVYISSTAVYGVPTICPVDEDDELKGVGAYGRAKIQAERLCEFHRQKGMCIPVIRPKSFIGPERLGAFELLFNFAADGRRFPVVGSGENRYQLLDVEDLSEAIFLCLTLDPRKANDTFNIGARRFETIRKDFQAVLDAAGYGKRVISFPKWLSVVVLRVLEALRMSPLYRWIYQTASKDSYVSTTWAAKQLGFRPRYSNRQALVRTFTWYVQNRDRIGCTPGLNHRTPWRHGLLTVLKGLL